MEEGCVYIAISAVVDGNVITSTAQVSAELLADVTKRGDVSRRVNARMMAAATAANGMDMFFEQYVLAGGLDKYLGLPEGDGNRPVKVGK